MRVLRALLVAAVAVTVAGCLQSTTTIKVRPDGSGTIETTTTMSTAAIAQLKQMMAGFGGKETAGKNELFSADQLRAEAGRMGEGVTFVSSQPIRTADGEGVHAIYAFKDVTRVRVSPTPSGPSGSEAAGLSGTGARTEDISFGFAHQPSGNAVLTLVIPEAPATDVPAARKAAPSTPPGPEQAQQLEMVKMLFKDMRIDIGVDVEGRIVKTNAADVTGNHVTLLQMDFGQLMSDPAKLMAIQNVKSLEEAKRALKDVKGFKMNLDRDLRIEFAAR